MKSSDSVFRGDCRAFDRETVDIATGIGLESLNVFFDRGYFRACVSGEDDFFKIFGERRVCAVPRLWS